MKTGNQIQKEIWGEHNALLCVLGKHFPALGRAIRNNPHLLFTASREYKGKYSFAQHSAHKYSPTYRTACTLPKMSRRCGIDLSERPAFTQALQAELSASLWKTEVLEHRGSAITEAYKNAPSGLGSCMTGADADKVVLYGDNPDKVSLLVVPDKARALLWKTDCGRFYLDRVYGSDGEARQALRQHARAKYQPVERTWDGYPCAGQFVDNTEDMELSISLRNLADVFPYMDTFFNVERGIGNRIFVSNYPRSEARETALSTDGGLYGTATCTYCGDGCEPYYTAPNGDEYCECCFDAHFTSCEQCGNHFPADEAHYVESTHSTICPDCLDNFFGACAECGEIFQDGDLMENRDGERVCDSCYENEQEEIENNKNEVTA